MNQQVNEAGGIPRGILVAASLLIGTALVATATARFGDVGTTRMPAATAVSVAQLHFTDRADGGIDVRNANSGALIDDVEPGTNGFLRSTMRGLARERNRSGIGREQPFVLTRWNNGTLSLEDPATGRKINLEAFGSTNSAVFARLMDRSSAPMQAQGVAR